MPPFHKKGTKLILNSLKNININCRCLYLGNFDAGREAVPRRQEQRGHRQTGERRTVGAAGRLSAPPLQSHVRVLGVRAQQTANLSGTLMKRIKRSGAMVLYQILGCLLP